MSIRRKPFVAVLLAAAGAAGFGAGDAWAHCTLPGTCHDAVDDCVDAPVGFWSDGEICHPCVPGQYTDMSKSTMCKSCPPGTFAAAVASVSCLLCPDGKVATQPGSSACASCAAGEGANGSRDACEPCAAGTFNDGMEGICKPCLALNPAADGGACDDGNGCTVDRCQAAKGCINETVPGCADAGTGSLPSDGGQTEASPEAGCGCTVAGSPRASWLALAVGAALVIRRRSSRADRPG